MVWHDKMGHFKENDVIEALGIFLHKLKIEPDRTALGTTAAPLRFHALDEEPVDPYRETILPERNALACSRSQFFTIPAIQNSLPLFGIGSFGHAELDVTMREGNIAARGIIRDPQQVPPPPEVVAFAFDILARGLALLPPRSVSQLAHSDR